MNAENESVRASGLYGKLFQAASLGVAHLLLTFLVMLLTSEAGFNRLDDIPAGTPLEFTCSILFVILSFPIIPAAALLEDLTRGELDPLLGLALNSAFWAGCFFVAAVLHRRSLRHRPMSAILNADDTTHA
ncbi:MAG TPA: hypothetical protein VF585_07525 [Chthoniobacterales bacterium]|jgi:hypothetical protein